MALLGGTRAHFTELNRGHQDLPPDLPALTFSSTPQMHASESRQILESIEMQRLTWDTGYEAADDPEATDPRQSSDALAAWTVASAAAFSPAGIASVSYFEASRHRGHAAPCIHRTPCTCSPASWGESSSPSSPTSATKPLL